MYTAEAQRTQSLRRVEIGASASFLKLRQKIRQIKELPLRLNFPFRVESKDPDAVEEKHVSGLGLKA
jgi:ABC-type antimicrobial peptide transport system ATPase subunit